MHLTFGEKCEEKLPLFFLLFYLIVWKLSEEDVGVGGSKMTFYESITASVFQNSSSWVMFGRGFLTHLCYEYPPKLPTPTLLKFSQTPISRCLQPSLPLLFLMSCFFDWMGDCETFDVWFHLMILWIHKCRALVP